jgi:hypothetical protein
MTAQQLYRLLKAIEGICTDDTMTHEAKLDAILALVLALDVILALTQAVE